MDCSIYPMCSFVAHVCRCAGDRKYWMCSNQLPQQKLVMVKPLYQYLDLTCFRPYIISYLPLPLHAFTELKSNFLGFVCIKAIPFTNKKYICISTLWWCFTMGGGKGIIEIFLWCSGLLLMDLPCIISICGLYIAPDLLMSSIVIMQFLI